MEGLSVKVALTRRQRKILEGFTRGRKVGQGLFFRASVILCWMEGLGIRETCRTLNRSRKTVRKWRKRWLSSFEAWGTDESQWDYSTLRKKIVEALSDEARSGAPVKFKAEEVCQIIAMACKAPSSMEIPVSHWSARDLREAVIQARIVPAISIRTVGRILKKAI
jgi:putative transposase